MIPPAGPLTFETRPEDELLICCARTRMNLETADRVRALLRVDLDWAYVFQMALRHGLMPLLYWNLSAVCPDAAPEASLTALRDHFHKNIHRNLFLTGELLKLLDLFTRHEICAVAYKGPILAASVYGNLALRYFGDLDIFVRKQDVAMAKDLLASEGYRLDYPLNPTQEAAYMEFQGQLPFSRYEGQSPVELHSDFTPSYYAFPLDLKGLWKRLEPKLLGGREVLTFSPEDLLLILCVHGAKHLWARLAWICDIAEIIRAHWAIDWARVVDQASELRSERILFLGLFLANALLGADLPEEVMRRIQADPMVHSLGRKVRKRLFMDADHPPGSLESCFFHLKARERLWDGARTCLGMAIIPTVEEWIRMPLPPSLSPLLYLFRPMRLIGKYGLGLVRQAVRLDLAPSEPTPSDLVERMIALAGVSPTDVVYDLGCGDGRIVITAAKRHGARGVGVDIDSRRIAGARAHARYEGVDHLVTFIRQDAKTVNVSPATVIMLYLTLQGNLRLRGMLQEQLRPGARIVSRRFDMADWRPTKTEIIENGNGATDALHLWRIEESACRRSPNRHVAAPGARWR